jgi:hypothetical protein
MGTRTFLGLYVRERNGWKTDSSDQIAGGEEESGVTTADAEKRKRKREEIRWRWIVRGIQSMMGKAFLVAHMKKLSVAAVSVLATFSAIQILALTGRVSARPNTPQVFSLPVFRYAIIYNDPALNGVGRDLTVMMDPSEFSEVNLRLLFDLLKQRFQDMPGFTVYIQTSLQDIATPEERETPGFSEGPSNPKAFKNPSATIKHSPRADTLYIYLPSRATEHPTKIDLRVLPNS